MLLWTDILPSGVMACLMMPRCGAAGAAEVLVRLVARPTPQYSRGTILPFIFQKFDFLDDIVGRLDLRFLLSGRCTLGHMIASRPEPPSFLQKPNQVVISVSYSVSRFAGMCIVSVSVLSVSRFKPS